MDDNGVRIAKRLAQLKAERSVHEHVWRQCFEYTFPIRADGFQGETLDAQSGLDKRAKLLDATGTDCSIILASALMSGLTPANARWFSLDVDGIDREAKAWLDEASDVLWANIHASNFDAVGFECMVDYTVAGWFAQYIDEDRKRGGLLFEQWPISQVYAAASIPGGYIDTVYRTYSLTAEQAVAEYSEAKVSDKVRNLAKDKPDTKIEFVHAIEPRHRYRESNGQQAVNMPVASCKVEADTGHTVSESGYHEMPVIVPRWMLIPRSVYAVGKVYDALPDIKELNDLEYLNKSALEMAIAPPLIAEDDGVLNPRTVKIGPRKIVVAASTDSIKPLYDGADVKTGWVAKEQLQAGIRKIMMADQLTPRDGPALTATEVHANLMLLRQLMGPTFGRTQPEYLQRMIERCFGLAYRAGALGQAPESLANSEFHVRYLSPLARAQKLEDVTAMDRFETALLTKSEALPDLLDLYDWDEADRHRSELLGVPQHLIRKPDEVEETRAAKAQAAQKAQAQEMAAPVLQEAGKAAVQRMAA